MLTPAGSRPSRRSGSSRSSSSTVGTSRREQAHPPDRGRREAHDDDGMVEIGRLPQARRRPGRAGPAEAVEHLDEGLLDQPAVAGRVLGLDEQAHVAAGVVDEAEQHLQGEHPTARPCGRPRRRRGRGCRRASARRPSRAGRCARTRSRAVPGVRRSSSLTDPAPVGGAVDGAVVHADQVPVAGHPDVALEPSAPPVDGPFVGGQGVLGDGRRTRRGARRASAGRRGRARGRGGRAVSRFPSCRARTPDTCRRRSRTRSDDRRARRVAVGLHRAARGLPGEHAALEVHRVVARAVAATP